MLNRAEDRRTVLKYALGLFAYLSGFRLAFEGPSAWGLDSLPNGQAGTNFRDIYGNAPQREAFLPFLKHVFRLYPEDEFHRLITDLSAKLPDDKSVYQELQKQLPGIKPFLSSLTYALPALRHQKEEMENEAFGLLADVKSFNGYLEIGTTGRYFNDLDRRLHIHGPVFVLNDEVPSYSVLDMFERGQIGKVGKYLAMGNYDAFSGKQMPEESVELVTNFIGFHHSPSEKRDGFVDSIWKVLKPGGKLIVRDHDVDSSSMNTLVALAHDVFNAGVGWTWEQNHDQIRNFTAVKSLTEYLVEKGFLMSDRRSLQNGDPTRNTLMLFEKPTTQKA